MTGIKWCAVMRHGDWKSSCPDGHYGLNRRGEQQVRLFGERMFSAVGHEDDMLVISTRTGRTDDTAEVLIDQYGELGGTAHSDAIGYRYWESNGDFVTDLRSIIALHPDVSGVVVAGHEGFSQMTPWLIPAIVGDKAVSVGAPYSLPIQHGEGLLFTPMRGNSWGLTAIHH